MSSSTAARWTTALPVIVAAAAYGIVGPSMLLSGLLAGAALLPSVLPQRLHLTSSTQLLLSLAGAVLGFVAINAVLGSPTVTVNQMRPNWVAFAGASLVVAVLRLYLHQPRGGANATTGLALVALAACGGLQTGYVYPLFVGAFVAAAAVSRRYADPARAPLSAMASAKLPALGLGLVLAGVVTAGWITALPPMHDWAVKQIMMRARNRTGFSNRLWLGSLRDTLQSETIVLRVHGRRIDYLRGIVYARYQAGRWSRASRDWWERRKTLPRFSPSPQVTEIQFAGDEPTRYFVPLDATAVAVPTGLLQVARSGMVAPVANEAAKRIWFITGGSRQFSIAAPNEEDRRVPPKLAPRLQAIATNWTPSATNVPAQLAALQARLQTHYRYSLDFQRHGDDDPLLDFLLRNRQGHCEYFASAMALLSRSLGIAARVIGGYRVVERNELGGYSIVRERDAHTWVEAWVPGKGWLSYDPTPPDPNRPSVTTTPGFAALLDIVKNAWAEALSWLDEREPIQIITPLVALIAAALGLRWLRRRRRRHNEERRDYGAALPCFEQLRAALARVGLHRKQSEPLEKWAQRLLQAALPVALTGEAASLLRRYAALRYGSEGDEQQLARAIGEYCKRLGRHTRRRGPSSSQRGSPFS